MSLQDFFSPLKADRFHFEQDYSILQMGGSMEVYAENKKFPLASTNAFDIVIFGVMDDRSAIANEGTALAPDYFRAQFYQLFKQEHPLKIADLGNILPGKTVKDTYFAVKECVTELVKQNIFPIIIGGGQDISFAQYQAYEHLEQMVDLVCIDAQFDMDDAELIHSESFVGKIIQYEPNFLFNFSNIAYQNYLVSYQTVHTLEDMFFDVHRLGKITQDIEQMEPVIRNANMISFDMGAIRSSDALANKNANPNGLYGEDACKLCRYAGMSDKLSSIGFYEFNPKVDQMNQTAKLLAQMVWYTIDGFYHRKKEFPTMAKSDFYIYKTMIQGQSSEFIFIKSKITDRWWMQIPYPKSHFTNERYHWVPCLYSDYTQATEGELPDIWWRTYQKLY